jgi:hypothetical protein
MNWDALGGIPGMSIVIDIVYSKSACETDEISTQARAKIEIFEMRKMRERIGIDPSIENALSW